MKKMFCVCLLAAMVSVSCNKRNPQPGGTASGPPVQTGGGIPSPCNKEFVTDKPVKAGETGIILPVGSRICIGGDQKELRVQLPAGFVFTPADAGLMESTLPIYATYSCSCSVSGSSCNVFYADGIGFGCLQSSCTGSCTGRFTYKGYSVDRVVNLGDKSNFFSAPSVQSSIRELIKGVSPADAYSKFSLQGISFFLVQDEKTFLAKATCNCEGTQGCRLVSLRLSPLKGEKTTPVIYYCQGNCNGCELTVS